MIADTIRRLSAMKYIDRVIVEDWGVHTVELGILSFRIGKVNLGNLKQQVQRGGNVILSIGVDVYGDCPAFIVRYTRELNEFLS